MSFLDKLLGRNKPDEGEMKAPEMGREDMQQQDAPQGGADQPEGMAQEARDDAAQRVEDENPM